MPISANAGPSSLGEPIIKFHIDSIEKSDQRVLCFQNSESMKHGKLVAIINILPNYPYYDEYNNAKLIGSSFMPQFIWMTLMEVQLWGLKAFVDSKLAYASLYQSGIPSWHIGLIDYGNG
jgi:hypothetical protein